MSQKGHFNIIVKTILYWALFLCLQYSYEWMPVFPLNLVSVTSESLFQHQKIAFYAYLLANLVEIVFYWKKLDNQESYVYARLFSTVFIPWTVFLLWYLAAAVYGRLPNIPLEILYANLVVILTALAAIQVERALERISYSKSLKFVIVFLFLTSILLYFAFSYRLPWADVFTEPDWRP
jgi:hypothetical protein